jgi:hypothetical protein
MPPKIYCGANEEPPKNSEFGTMRECKEKGQLRRYGRYKADKKILDYKAEKKQAQKSYIDNILAAAKIRGKKNQLKKNIPYEKDPEKKKEMQAEYEKLVKLDKYREVKNIDTTKAKKIVNEIEELQEKSKDQSKSYEAAVKKFKDAVELDKPKKTKKAKTKDQKMAKKYMKDMEANKKKLEKMKSDYNDIIKRIKEIKDEQDANKFFNQLKKRTLKK